MVITCFKAIHCIPSGWFRKTSRNIRQHQQEQASGKGTNLQSFNCDVLLTVKCCIHPALNCAHANSFRTSERTLYVLYKDQWLITLCKTMGCFYKNLIRTHKYPESTAENTPSTLTQFYNLLVNRKQRRAKSY